MSAYSMKSYQFLELGDCFLISILELQAIFFLIIFHDTNGGKVVYDDVSEIRGSDCHHTILYLRWYHEITEDELRTLVCVASRNN